MSLLTGVHVQLLAHLRVLTLHRRPLAQPLRLASPLRVHPQRLASLLPVLLQHPASPRPARPPRLASLPPALPQMLRALASLAPPPRQLVRPDKLLRDVFHYVLHWAVHTRLCHSCKVTATAALEWLVIAAFCCAGC